MKTTILYLAFMLSLGFTVNAQDKPADIASAKQQTYSADDLDYMRAATKDVIALSNTVALSADQKEKLKPVFEQKHRTFAKTSNVERKKAFSQSLEAKIKSSLEPEQIKKLEADKKLMRTLTEI